MTSADRPDGSVPTRWTASTTYADMWVDPDDDPRDAGAELVDERTTLIDYLRAYRLTLEMKCAGLDATQLASRSAPPSTMSLLGLVRHMAEVERYWFRCVMGGSDVPKLYCSDDDPDGDWDGSVADPAVVADAWMTWRNEVAAAEGIVGEPIDLSTLGRRPNGDSLQLREVLVHMIEEYARHCGHADILRERVDGRVGQ